MIMVAVMLIGSLNSANQKSDIFGVLTAIPPSSPRPETAPGGAGA